MSSRARTTLPLDSGWTLKDLSGEVPELPAIVPGCVQDALLKEGHIKTIDWRFNEVDWGWIGEKAWSYRCTVELAADFLEHEHIALACEGLDTLARILINGVEVGRADNMFRTWRFCVKDALKAGSNTLEIIFDSVLPLMRQKTQERMLPAWNESHNGGWGYTGRGYVRKQACQFGWDWGPVTVSAGPFLPLCLEAWDHVRIDQWRHAQAHEDGQLTLSVDATLEGELPQGAKVLADLSYEGESQSFELQVDGSAASGELRVENPRLWWPAGMGEQPLYELSVRLVNAEGGTHDERKTRIGLRELELIREKDAWGTSLTFAVNGQRFFSRGANLIPIDQYPSSQGLERYDFQLQSCVQANMNMLRVWGGGYFLHQAFYDRCDELGILIWQDMMFGCGTYPTWDQAFLDNVAAETRDQVLRLGHHACLACWCGNNELEMGLVGDDWNEHGMAWDDYALLFDEHLPKALEAAWPNSTYIPGSPHSAPDERRDVWSNRSGDLHMWNVWFSTEEFETYRKWEHRFVSEFGYQSFPEPASLLKITHIDNERPLDGQFLNFRQRSHPGNKRVLEGVRQWFRMPERWQDAARLSQIVHGNGIRIGVEYWRSIWPRCAGATYWQLNDVWTAPTWSSIDYQGQWKALQYFARRFFANRHLVGIENAEDATVELVLLNDTSEAYEAEARILLYDTEGELYLEKKQSLSAPARGLSEAWKPDVSEAVLKVGRERALLFLELVENGEVVAENIVLFARPKNMELADPGLSLSVNGAEVEVRCKKPALWCWIESEQEEEHDPALVDNYASIRPGRSWKTRSRDGEALPSKLTARSVYGTQG